MSYLSFSMSLNKHNKYLIDTIPLVIVNRHNNLPTLSFSHFAYYYSIFDIIPIWLLSYLFEMLPIIYGVFDDVLKDPKS